MPCGGLIRKCCSENRYLHSTPSGRKCPIWQGRFSKDLSSKEASDYSHLHMHTHTHVCKQVRTHLSNYKPLYLKLYNKTKW
jgi:hypothetical protein